MKYFFSTFLLMFFFNVNVAKVYDDKSEWKYIFCNNKNIMYAGGKNTLEYFENNTKHIVELPSEMVITALYEYNNQLLIGTGKGDIYKYSLFTHTIQLIVHARSEISNIEYTNHQFLITTLGKGFAVISLTDARLYNTSNLLTDNYIYKVITDKNNNIWGASDAGIFYLSDSISYPAFNTQLSDKLITALEYKNDFLYCGTQNGDLYQIDLNKNLVINHDNNLWAQATINDIIKLEHSIVFATSSGAFSISTDANPKIDTLIFGKKILDLEMDLSGAVWACGEQYLAKHYVGFFRLITQNKKYIHTMVGDRKGNLWFTPDAGLMRYIALSHESEIVKSDLITDQTEITSMFIDKNDHLWLGTAGHGVLLYNTNDKTLKAVNIDNSVESSHILSITGNAEKIWVATLNGVWYVHLNDQPPKFYSLEEDLKLKKNYVYNIFLDHEQNLWLATDGQGILKLKDNKIEAFSKNRNIDTKVFYKVIQDRHFNRWFNAYHDGIYCVTADSVFHLNVDNGLQTNDILGIYNIDSLSIIAVSAAGVDVVDIAKHTVMQIPFSISNYSCVPELNSITNLGDQIYIGTDIGILQFQIPLLKGKEPDRSFISSVLVADKPVSMNEHYFDHDENYIKFNISTGNTFEEKTWLRYNLQGLNNLWVNAGSSEITFPRLNAGHYTFRLQSANNSAFKNASEVSYSFTIDKPFWKKWWFIVLSICIIVLVARQYLQYREHKISRLQLLEKEKAIAEYEALKAQINPHFLFNSFNTLMQVIDENKDRAIEYTQHLSDFYRSLIAFREHDLIVLQEDIEILKNYIFLQKMRFGNSLRFDIDIPAAEIMAISVPPLTLQMLAENAIKHNIVSENKVLNIKIYTDAYYIIFENNLQLKHNAVKGEGMGLQNIKNRYNQYADIDVEILVTENFFIVKLPKINLSL